MWSHLIKFDKSIMKKVFLSVIVCCLATAIFAQQPLVNIDTAEELAQEITGDVISRHLHVLVSDTFEGRETGTPGNALAAEYLADQFKEMGIPPVKSLGGYFQEVVFSRVFLTESKLRINGTDYAHLKDFIIPVETIPGGAIQFAGDEVLFLGYGIDDPTYSDYRGKDVKGKAIFIYKGEPVQENGISWISGQSALSKWSDGIDEKLRTAADHGVAMVYVLEDQFRTQARKERMYALGGEMIMGVPDMSTEHVAPYVLISSNIAGALLSRKSEKVIKTRDKIRAKGKPKSVRIKVNTEVSGIRKIDSTPGQNVLGYIEGTDPTLKDEVIVFTAHYDHLGKRGDDIFYGADDNGSGTSAVVAIASAFAKAKELGVGPRRSVLCMLVTGEEKGLLGSEYYTEFPVFPLTSTVANINIDMIGRMDEAHDQPDYTYVIGADRMSSELHEINESVNTQYTHLELDYTYNEESDPNRFYYRSDHYNFAKNGVPAIFFFSGVHADYHRPSDTIDKIMFDRAAKIARLAFHTGWELANRDHRIKVDRS
jgi:Zn-dependent M28 family amino/carboxypeptidase